MIIIMIILLIISMSKVRAPACSLAPAAAASPPRKPFCFVRDSICWKSIRSLAHDCLAGRQSVRQNTREDNHLRIA